MKNIADLNLPNFTKCSRHTWNDTTLLLFQQLESFSFISIWYGVLFQINVASKYMQSQNFDWCNSSKLAAGFREIL
jgi:hypothetical protein